MNQFGSQSGVAELPDAQNRRARDIPEMFPAVLRRAANKLEMPSGLVVSADDRIRGALGEALLLCGIDPALAASIAEARKLLVTGDAAVILCQDILPDGNYTDLLQLEQRTSKNIPIIVVSRIGDWADYFTAMDLGAYDFLAFLLVPDELQRIVRHYFANRHQQDVLSTSLA